MMGADLMERFRVAGLNAAGQRRTVTILFADLSGFTVLSQMLDTEEVFLIIQQFMNLLIKDVYKYDGMVDKMLGDGLMAIFGAPIGHENHPELGIRAASEMMSDIRRFNHQIHERYGAQIKKNLQLSMHVALHSGEVIVGGIGSNMLLNYTAVGDTVNLTSRLLDAANPGVILVSESI
jgi:adenylate cyclase